MRLTKAALLAASVALAFGSLAHAADEDPPGFNELDKDNSGELTRSEAAGNKSLAAQFGEVDADGDGKLTRGEYLKTMAAKDFRKLREKTAELLEPDDKGKQASAAAGTSRQGTQASQERIQALSPDLIRKVQQALNDKGHEAGPVDGIWGPRTQRGVRDFQKSQDGMKADGQLDARTLAALGIARTQTSASAAGAQQQQEQQQQGASAGGSRQQQDAKPQFSNLDANNDGQISLAEAAADTRISKNFQGADKDSDQRLSKEEFQAAMQSDTQSGASAGGSAKRN
jgi:peptidoglycan hydrolase-like protein with peptidoglycan-binding domain